VGISRINRTLVTAVVAVAAAVALRVGAAFLDVPVLVPDRTDGGLRPLDLGPIVIVTVGVTVVAALVTAALDRVRPSGGRRIARWLGMVVLVVSLVPVVTTEGLETANRVVLGILHLVVAAIVLHRVVRDT
jgi:hypothetical protein